MKEKLLIVLSVLLLILSVVGVAVALMPDQAVPAW